MSELTYWMVAIISKYTDAQGTGLSDATPIHGEDIFPLALQIPWMGATIGNHGEAL